MQQLSFSATSRRNADKNLLTVLLVGIGGSLAFHIAAITGVANFWKPVAAIEEPMEITMVDVDTEKPSVKPAPKTTPVVPIIKTPPKVELKTEPAKPVPIVKVPAKLEPKPAPIVKTAASLNNPVDRTPAKPLPKPNFAPQPKALAPPAFRDELFKAVQPPTKAPVTPEQKVAKSSPPILPQPEQPKTTPDSLPEPPSRKNQSGLANNSPNRKLAAPSTAATPTPIQNEDLGGITPSKVDSPVAETAPNANNQSGLTSNPANNSKLAGRLDRNNSNATTDDNFKEVVPSKIKTPTNEDLAKSNSRNQSSLASKPSSNSKLKSRSVGNSSEGRAPSSDSDPSGITPGSGSREARVEPGTGRNDGTSSGGKFGLQCINRCEISGLTDLEDRDGGKDKLRIKIAINPNGNVTSASIAKSSGNSTIDRVVIDGVKQMEFSPPGKVVERVVKANILL